MVNGCIHGLQRQPSAGHSVIIGTNRKDSTIYLVTTPKMKNVFLIEASMRAYQMAGWSRPEAKAWFEKTYGPVALEVAIITMALIENEDDDYGVDMVADEADFKRWVKTLKDSPKFRDAIKKNAAQLIAIKKKEISGEGRAFSVIGKIAQEFMVEPEGYAGETALELEDGWKWVHLTDEECRSFEGSTMQHCGQSVGIMYSLRDNQGKPHVSMDVSPAPNGIDDGPINIPSNDIIQLRGKQNAIPDVKYWPKIKELVKQVGAKDLWDSYAQPGEDDASRGVVLSRKIAGFMELGWAHDPADREEKIPNEPTPLDQYEF